MNSFMVEKIIVNPLNVRGHGNVVSSKTVEDFTVYNSSLSYEDSFYTMEFRSSITLSLVVSSGTVSVGEAVTCTATVLDDDTPVSGVSVSFYDGTTSLGTGTTNSSGVATYTTSSLSAGSHSLSAEYDDSTSNVVTVTVVAYDDIVLSADDSILSYYDGDSTTLRAQLMDGSSTASVSGVTVEFFNGSTSMGTAQTDSNGVAVKTYTSAGVGDVSFSAEADNGTLVSETYEIEDCREYQPMTSNAHQSRWTIPSAVTSASIFGYSSEGWKFGNSSSYSTISRTESQTLPYSMEFTVTNRNASNDPQPIFGAYLGSNYLMINCGSNNVVINVNGSRTTYSHSYTLPFIVRFELTSTTVSVYVDDVLIGSKTHSLTGNPVPTFQTGSNRWNVIKDYKIKPL